MNLTERLREAHKWGATGTSLFGEAADEIERLRDQLSFMTKQCQRFEAEVELWRSLQQVT